MHGDGLTAVFAVVALLVALNMGLTGVDSKITSSIPTGAGRQAIGLGIGGFDAMMGFGGGTLGVPILSLCGVPTA